MATSDPRILSEAAVRRVVLGRDQGRCRRCGKPARDMHHRITAGSGGSRTERVHGVAARVMVCGFGTSSGCHQWIGLHPEDAYATGWLIRRNGSELPSEVPLTTIDGWQFFLTDEGTVVPLDLTAS